jgi:hypothetical protein
MSTWDQFREGIEGLAKVLGLSSKSRITNMRPRFIKRIVILAVLFQFGIAGYGQGWSSGWQTGWPTTQGGPIETVIPPLGILTGGSSRYNFPLGPGGINFSAGFRALYVDNVFLTQTDARNDFVLIPECDLGAFFPIGRSNSLNLDLGLAYYDYLKNTSLNTGAPVISPDSEIAFHIRTGDFTLRFSESFSYQESPVYDEGAEFFNIYQAALFRHYENIAGITATWNLPDLVTEFGYHHDDLWSDGSFYNYVNHASELFDANSMYAFSPLVTAGLETAASVNNFDHRSMEDNWRVRMGPALRLDVSQFFKVRVGAGYERIDYDSGSVKPFGVHPDDTYYAYAGVDHTINRVFSHSLEVSHDNQIGINAGNLAGTHVLYAFFWRPNHQATLSPHVSSHWFDESFGSGSSSLYHERFTYVLGGFSARYQWDKHWRTTLSWDYRLKDSDIEGDGYGQNQVSLEGVYQF